MNKDDVIKGMPVWLNGCGPGTIIGHSDDKEEITVAFWFVAGEPIVPREKLYRANTDERIAQVINRLTEPQELREAHWYPTTGTKRGSINIGD